VSTHLVDIILENIPGKYRTAIFLKRIMYMLFKVINQFTRAQLAKHIVVNHVAVDLHLNAQMPAATVAQGVVMRDEHVHERVKRGHRLLNVVRLGHLDVEVVGPRVSEFVHQAHAKGSGCSRRRAGGGRTSGGVRVRCGGCCGV
jgi:hypothetical protein